MKKKAKKQVNKTARKKAVKRAPAKNASAEDSSFDKETLKYLKMAFDLEKKAMTFYMTARSQTEDFNMKTFLNTLLDMEIDHYSSVGKVKRMYEHHKTAQLKKEAAKFEAHKPESPFKGLKQWQKLDKSKANIHDIFKTAITMEERAHNFYLDAAKHAKGEFIRLYLQRLAKDEWYHKQFIESHKEAIYNNGYWLGIEHVRIES